MAYHCCLYCCVPAAFGEITELTLDQDSYDFNDSQIVLSSEIAEQLKQSHGIHFAIYPPNSDDYDIDVLTKIKASDHFRFLQTITTANFEESGTYTLIATDQADGHQIFHTFEFTAIPPPEPSTDPKDIESINPFNELNDRIDTLEQENADLKRQITDLNKRIDDLLAIIQLQIETMMVNF